MVKGAVTTTYAYNNNNQLLTETTGGTTFTYAYDRNGNLLSKTGGGSTTTYAWDWRNLLLSVTGPAGSTVYEYDGSGNRISKTQAGVKTKYINDVAYSLVQVLMETNNAGAVQAIYNYGNDLISMNRAGVNSYYHYDGLGSTRQMTDSNEAVVANYTYDAFGNSVVSVSSVANTYGFTGEQQFGEADDLVFLRARYYKPSIGRFISRDPIGYWGGLNLYAYVENNPVDMTDPHGLLGYSPWPGHPPIPMQPSCGGVAEEEYERERRNPDAYMRHCLTSCRIASRMGNACAWAVGLWNEWRPGRWGESNRRQGLHDNAIGRGCSDDTNGCAPDRPKSCEECCGSRRGT